jgi:RNA polymerase sigma-70 factor (ECF subfamily)
LARIDVESPGDDELVDLAAGGDRLAFGSLVGRHGSSVYQLAFRLTRDSELAADVAQETWIRAWRGLPSFRREASFGTWIYRITANTAASARRRRGRHPTSDLAALPEPEAGPATHPEAVADRAEMARLLGTALSSLSSSLRVVVVMKDVEGWTHLEIAQALGISVTATKVRLHRAHQRLQRYLREKET